MCIWMEAVVVRAGYDSASPAVACIGWALGIIDLLGMRQYCTFFSRAYLATFCGMIRGQQHKAFDYQRVETWLLLETLQDWAFLPPLSPSTFLLDMVCIQQRVSECEELCRRRCEGVHILEWCGGRWCVFGWMERFRKYPSGVYLSSRGIGWTVGIWVLLETLHD